VLGQAFLHQRRAGGAHLRVEDLLLDRGVHLEHQAGAVDQAVLDARAEVGGIAMEDRDHARMVGAQEVGRGGRESLGEGFHAPPGSKPHAAR
jgi:hypothetical protein